nr:hypothetical protein [Oscillospiraceae bacterium]
MEKIERSMEEQVWRRVIGTPEPMREDIRPLLLAAWEAASLYRHLAGLMTGRTRERAKLLERRGMDSVAALKGILRLSGGQPGNLLPVPIPKEPARRLLEKRYFRSLHLMAEYTARALDPEFGVVFQQLADRERQNSTALAELLGRLEA